MTYIIKLLSIAGPRLKDRKEKTDINTVYFLSNIKRDKTHFKSNNQNINELICISSKEMDNFIPLILPVQSVSNLLLEDHYHLMCVL